jgi:hypothetical protein
MAAMAVDTREEFEIEYKAFCEERGIEFKAGAPRRHLLAPGLPRPLATEPPPTHAPQASILLRGSLTLDTWQFWSKVQELGGYEEVGRAGRAGRAGAAASRSGGALSARAERSYCSAERHAGLTCTLTPLPCHLQVVDGKLWATLARHFGVDLKWAAGR